MPLGFSRASPTRVTLLIGLLTVTVLLASLLAYEAHDAARAERVTAERALKEYATLAAWEFQSSVKKALDGAALRALGAVTTGYAASPYDPLAPLSALRAGAEQEFRCGDGSADTERTYARIDLRTGAAQFEPEPIEDGARDRLLAVMRRAASRLPPPEAPYALEAGVLASPPRAVIVGVRYARLGAPAALYGFTVCASALEQRLPEMVTRDHRLLPSSIATGAPNDSLLSLTLSRAGGQPVFRFGWDNGSAYRTTVAMPELGGLTAEVALRQEAAGQLLVGPPERSRVALLMGLLALTAALGVIALVQIRREHELAQLRTDFTSSVSHELRTPLAQILLFGETLSLGRARTPDDRRLAAETIVQEAKRLMHLVDNILHFARPRREVVPLQLSPVAVRAMLGEVVSGFAPLAEATAAQVRLDVDGDPVVIADAGALRQILLNLLDNATKYGRPGQTIRVAARAAAGQVRIAVDDEGDGIPVNDRERIWMPYVRLTSGGFARRGGSGLGLAVVRELAELQGGRVWVEESAGGGSSFVVELKLAVDDAVTAARTGRGFEVRAS